MTGISVRTHTRDGAQVVELAGDLDGRTARTAEETFTTAVSASGEVVVELSGVRYMSSAGLRVILLLYRRAQCLGARIALVGLSEELRGVMQATGFLGFFAVADTVEQGLRLLRAEGRP